MPVWIYLTFCHVHCKIRDVWRKQESKSTQWPNGSGDLKMTKHQRGSFKKNGRIISAYYIFNLLRYLGMWQFHSYSQFFGLNMRWTASLLQICIGLHFTWQNFKPNVVQERNFFQGKPTWHSCPSWLKRRGPHILQNRVPTTDHIFFSLKLI